MYVFIERGERRKKERERNVNVWLPLMHPYRGPGLQLRHVPWLGIELVTLCFAAWCSVHWDIPARALFLIFWWSLTVFLSSSTSLQSHQLFMRVCFSPHLHQHLFFVCLFVCFLIVAIMTGVRWYLIVGFFSFFAFSWWLVMSGILTIYMSFLEKCLFRSSDNF